MPNFILQPPVITQSTGTPPVKTVTIEFKVGPDPVESFDLTLYFDPAVLKADTLEIKSPEGWTILGNVLPSTPNEYLISGYSLTPLQPTSSAVKLSIQLQPDVDTFIAIGLSGSYNDPAI